MARILRCDAAAANIIDAALLRARDSTKPELLLALVLVGVYVFAGVRPSKLAAVLALWSLPWVHRDQFNSELAQEFVRYIVGTILLCGALYARRNDDRGTSFSFALQIAQIRQFLIDVSSCDKHDSQSDFEAVLSNRFLQI